MPAKGWANGFLNSKISVCPGRLIGSVSTITSSAITGRRAGQTNLSEKDMLTADVQELLPTMPLTIRASSGKDFMEGKIQGGVALIAA